MDIPRRIRAAAVTHPDRTALIDAVGAWTSRTLVGRMDRAAAALEAAGLRQGNVIATLAGSTADHVVLYLGAAALGVAVADR